MKSRPRRVRTTYHHGSHRALLGPAWATGHGADLDAIVVPTIHPPTGHPTAGLDEAVALADWIECPLLVLCSRDARAEDVVHHYRDSVKHPLIASDIPSGLRLLAESGFATASFPSASSGRRVDTGTKRNVGILTGHMCGWEKIMFLDDDIIIPDPADVRRAAYLLERYDSVGLNIGGYPDNSVVCHAHRIGRGHQDTFLGGGALAVLVPKSHSFFPDIYNEDWLFLLDRHGFRPATMIGEAKQRAYDPFERPDRATYEEFGEVIAEGLFYLLDRGRPVLHANGQFWRWFLGERRRFVRDVEARIRQVRLDPGRRQSIIRSLQAAQERLATITPDECMAYLDALQRDLRMWEALPSELPLGLVPLEALRSLGLDAVLLDP